MISFFLITVLIALVLSTAGLVLFYYLRFSSGAAAEVPTLDLILPPLLINNLCIMVIMAVFGIFFSHRIAGPLYHIETVVADVLAGRGSERVQLRPRDFVHDLADQINALLDEYSRVKK